MLPIVVLSGGLATRLRPVTEKIPKSLIEVCGQPFVFHQLELFLTKGFRHIHFCLGYLGTMVEDAIVNSRYPSRMDITFSYDGEQALGTGGAVKKALPYISHDFFVTYGDSYLDISFMAVEEHYHSRTNRAAGVMVVYRNAGQFDRSNAIFENGVLFYSKKHVSERMSHIDYGVSILNKAHFSGHTSHGSFDLSDVLENLASQGNLLGYEVYNRFYEIGSFKGIEDLTNHLKQNI